MSKTGKQRRARKRSTPRQGGAVQLLQILQQMVCGITIFVAPTLLYLGNTDYGFTKITFIYFAVAVLYVLWGIQSWLQNEWRIHLPGLLYPALGLLVAGTLSLINAINPGAVIQSLSVLMSFILFYVYIANQAPTRRALYFYLSIGLLAAFANGVYGLFQYYGMAPAGAGIQSGAQAMLSGLGNKNFLAEFLALWVMPSLLLLLAFKNPLVKGLILLAHTVNFAAFILADSTGALLGFVAGALVLTVASVIWRRGFYPVWQHKAWVGAWLVLLVVAFFSVEPPDFLKNILNSPEQVNATELQPMVQKAGLASNPIDRIGSIISSYWAEGSGNVRAADWWIAVEMFKTQPVFGVGLGHYQTLFLDYKAAFLQTDFGKTFDQHIVSSAHAHNEYLQTVAEMGVIGLIAMLAVLVALVWTAFRHVIRAPLNQQFIAVILYAGAAVFLADGLVNFPAHLPASALSLALLLGLTHSEWGYRAKPMVVQDNAVRVLVTVMLIFSVSISVFAARDWQANQLLTEGVNHIRRDLFTLARPTLESSLALDFHPDEVFNRLGHVYQQLGDLDKAEAFYERSLTTFPMARAYYDLAGIKDQKGLEDESMALLDKLYLTRPDNVLLIDSELLRAYLLLKKGEYESAQARLENLQKTVDHPRIWYWLAQSMLAQRKTREATELLQDALEEIDKRILWLEGRLAEIGEDTVLIQQSVDLNNRYEINLQVRQQTLEALNNLGL